MNPEVLLQKIFSTLLYGGGPPPVGFQINDIFKPEDKSPVAVVRNCFAAFLMSLSSSDGSKSPGKDYLRKVEGGKTGESKLARFLIDGLNRLKTEMQEVTEADQNFLHELTRLADFCTSEIARQPEKLQRGIRNFFFPEGDFDTLSPGEDILRLRGKRRVVLHELNKSPISNPAGEIIFTSNVLLTLPPEGTDIDELSLPYQIREHLHGMSGEGQQYWYDHPIQMGTAPENNEILYGLKNLNETIAFEKKRGTVAPDAEVTCLLSVSVTHTGLQHIARDYLEYELNRQERLEHLKIYAFTEEDCRSFKSRVILPAAVKTGIKAEEDIISEIFGVDGEYGRHYSFLKAITALWQVCSDPGVKGTFKIDLDQVFPQELLIRETGSSAFEHFSSPVWGAKGEDEGGRPVYLGMIAGALVNEKDIHRGLFTPDVSFGEEEKTGSSIFFYSGLPQALSTEAEMMTRYGKGSEPDGISACIHRIHVTGGTNGILIDALRRYRPFTPTFIGRAEDQAYILSVLFKESGAGYLRYAHQSGLIMRHDKEAFAGDAIEAARIGKLVGDYIRTLLFSFYARSLPWDIGDIKEIIDPFTGCFVSRIPFSVVLLRMVMKGLELIQDGPLEDAVDFALQGSERLGELMNSLRGEENFVSRRFQEEERGWNLYYDILDALEKQLRERDAESLVIGDAAEEIVEECRVQK